MLAQLDGKTPNLALMRLAAHHRGKGDFVELRRFVRTESISRELWDNWDLVYGSAIFEKSRPLAIKLLEEFPGACVGGTGYDEKATLERYGISASIKPDYSDYPAFTASMGYTQRGCRFECGFCKVPRMEGKVKSVSSVYDIWRGEPWPRHLLLLDNDFFGQADWRKVIEDIVSGGFKVCFNQGFNARVLSDEQAAAIASTNYRDDRFLRKRLYVAWDSIGDGKVLFRGLNALVKYGVKPDNIMVYMLIGYDDSPEDREYRRAQLREFGAKPYPMPFDRSKPELIGFQRWVIGAYDKRVSWERWQEANYRPERLGSACQSEVV